MDRELFLQSSVRIRNLEKKLLTKAQFERLIGATSLQEAFKYLNESIYSEELSKLEQIENFDDVFSNSLYKMYDMILEMSPEKELIKVLTYKYAFHNIKVALKEKILEENFSGMYSKLYENIPEIIKKQLEGELKDLGNWYENTALQAYKIYQETGDPQKIEIFIDKQYFQKILETVRSFDLPILEKYFRRMIDFINIRALIRCQKQGQSLELFKEVAIDGGYILKEEIMEYFYREPQEIAKAYKNSEIGKNLIYGIKEYKETGLLLGFEKYMEDYLTNLLREVKKITYGPEVLFAYVHAKEMEIKNLRITFVGKANELPSDFIKERLRETYV